MANPFEEGAGNPFDDDDDEVSPIEEKKPYEGKNPFEETNPFEEADSHEERRTVPQKNPFEDTDIFIKKHLFANKNTAEDEKKADEEYVMPDDVLLEVKPRFLPIVDQHKSLSTRHTDISHDNTPIFSKRDIILRIPPEYTGDITHLTVSKNWLVCLLDMPTTQQTLFFRCFLPRVAITPGEIILDKYITGYKISKLFLDPTGHHTLISLVPKSQGLSADFLYINSNGPKVRRIEKFKDHEITSVAFNRYLGTEKSTGPILLGTSRGLIFETELNVETAAPLYKKTVYDLGLGRPKYAITDIELTCIPDTNKYIVIAAANDCLFTFQETLKHDERSLQAIFSAYTNGLKTHGAEVVETDLNFSVLRFYALPNAKFPSHWGWLCGAGIQLGKLSTEPQDTEEVLQVEETIGLDFKERKHLSYEERNQYLPKTIAMTEHHVLLLFNDHITGICLLNQEVVYEEYFHEKMGKLRNIVRDNFTGALYLYTNKMLFTIVTHNEKRNIWQIYLDKGLYDLALKFASDDPIKLDIVLVQKAESEFQRQEYLKSADIYAETEEPFESVCLKFVEFEDKRPLIRYVTKRINTLRDLDESSLKESIKMLVIWMVDLYLTQINMPERPDNECASWQREFDEFMKLERVSTCTRENKEEIQKLISQHADTHNLTQFAIANGDYEEVVRQYLTADNYKDALRVLREQKNLNLYYKYCPMLIEEYPQETVEMLMAQARKLDYSELMPTLIVMIESPRHVEEIIKFLEYIIFKVGETNSTMHNFLIRLYANHKPHKLMPYFENEGTDVSLIHYDINLALQVCLASEHKRAGVFLETILELWSNAVDLALEFDVALAKETANKHPDEEMRRTYWLLIAEHEINGTSDVKKVLDLLKECELLSIEDLLPFFSDFEKIDDFKEPITNALQEYNNKIQELNRDMDECRKQTEQVQADLQNVRGRVVRIAADAICNICDKLLLTKHFFIFVCGHKFHGDCLEKQIKPMLTSEKCRNLSLLKQQYEQLLTQSIVMNENSEEDIEKRQKIKLEIEEILASECLFCGLMIDTIDKPFVEDWDQVNVDWE